MGRPLQPPRRRRRPRLHPPRPPLPPHPLAHRLRLVRRHRLHLPRLLVVLPRVALPQRRHPRQQLLRPHHPRPDHHRRTHHERRPILPHLGNHRRRPRRPRRLLRRGHLRPTQLPPLAPRPLQPPTNRRLNNASSRFPRP